MRRDLRKLTCAAAFAGVVGGFLLEAGPMRRPGRAPVAPAAGVTAGAARVVLDAAGIGSGVTERAVDRALGALAASVPRQSDPDALRMAFRAYYRYRGTHPEKELKPFLYFVDYGLESTTPRGYVFDMQSLKVVDGPFAVAHGRGSAPAGAAVPTRFSNREGSNASSLGLYLAEESYSFTGRTGGKAYHSVGLRLAGLSGAFNGAARARKVVMHGAPYVTATRAGRSEGCPAVEPARAKRLIPLIARGGLVFLFSPGDRNWVERDPWGSAGAASGRG